MPRIKMKQVQGVGRVTLEYFRIYKMNIPSDLLKEYDEYEYGADYTYTANDDSGRCFFIIT